MNRQNNVAVKVLLVDDEPSILVALDFLVKQLGYQVFTATNGDEALEAMQKYQPNVAVLDVMMPRMSGFDVAKKIRANEDFDQTKIIFLTALGTQADRFEGYGSGAEIYVTKPFNNEDLVNTIKELVEYG